MYLRFIILLPITIAGYCIAQRPPVPRGVITISSNHQPGVSISYKETNICETTPEVKSWSGYVNLPASLLGGSYNVSIFFWYFEARKNPRNAPLALYVAGGPGQSSLYAVTGQGGPCYINKDSRTTAINRWSWNDNVNVLYIDQPAQTGFSYDLRVRGVLEQVSGLYTPQICSKDPIFTPNVTALYGTFPSQMTTRTANTSQQIAHQLYHFTQNWVNDFPYYRTSNSKISVWTHSAGGQFGPVVFAFFQNQNERIKNYRPEQKCRHCKNTETILDLDVLGIRNGCIDSLYEMPIYPQFAYKNTYNLSAISEEIYQQRIQEAKAPGGCLQQIQQCRSLASQLDPQGTGNDGVVNSQCASALFTCFTSTAGGLEFSGTGRAAFDIAQTQPNPFPYGGTAAYFNSRPVQEALGVPINFTANSKAVSDVFLFQTGDSQRSNTGNLEYILSSGLRVALVFGDRDYRCNWLGGQNISLSLQHAGNHLFKSSGYAELVTNSSYVAGVVRQAGSLSFSRVFEAGHYVHAQQQETVYRIFNRALFSKDIATGLISTAENSSYRTEGPESSFGIKSVLPLSQPILCSTWQVAQSCTANQAAALLNGSAVVENYLVVSPLS